MTTNTQAAAAWWLKRMRDGLNVYQQFSAKYVVPLSSKMPPGIYYVLGLCDEAGELAGKIKKYHRDGTDGETLRKDIEKEMGDVLWYLAAVARDFGIDLGDVALTNIGKLSDRLERAALRGSGDDR